MRKNKISNYLFGFILFVFTILIISSTLHSSKSVKNRTTQHPDVWLIGKGAFFSDTIKQTYKHVYSDFPLLELDGRYEHATIIEGYENGRKYLKSKIQNDTLFLMMAKPRSQPVPLSFDNEGRNIMISDESKPQDTIPAIVDGDYPIRAIIGARSIESITLKGEAHIDIPVRPYGANPDGETVYKPEDWEKYVLRSPELDLHLFDKASAELFLEVKNVRLNLNNSIISNSLQTMTTIMGEANKLSIINPKGYWLLNAPNPSAFKVDTLIVHSDYKKGAHDSGVIGINCNEYLEAHLLYNMDIIYNGNPEIVKTEQDYGRVINSN